MSWYPAFLRPFSCSCTRIRLVRHWGSGWEREACVAKLGPHIMKSGGGGETRRYHVNRATNMHGMNVHIE